MGAGEAFRTQFRLAASMAVRSNAYTAIRFEKRGQDFWYAVYRDGNHNGVRAIDIVVGQGRPRLRAVPADRRGALGSRRDQPRSAGDAPRLGDARG